MQLSQISQQRVLDCIYRELLSAGARADVRIALGYPVTHNDPALTARMAPTLARVARDGKAAVMAPVMGAEDFSFFQQRIPGLYIFLGVTPDGVDPAIVEYKKILRDILDARPSGTRQRLAQLHHMLLERTGRTKQAAIHEIAKVQGPVGVEGRFHGPEHAFPLRGLAGEDIPGCQTGNPGPITPHYWAIARTAAGC